MSIKRVDHASNKSKRKDDSAFNKFNNIIKAETLRLEAGALIDEFSDHTDPKYVGPGTWNVIHRVAFLARTKDEQLEFIKLMKLICSGFPCSVCRGHCTTYINDNPMEEFLEIKIDMDGKELELGMFLWSWKFHNAVNLRIDKPLMSWDTAYNLYSDSESLVCSSSCAHADNGQVNQKPKYHTPPTVIEDKSENLIKYGKAITITKHR